MSNYYNDFSHNEMELISIIVPIYNVEKYINKCIQSIINQTYMHIEILLIDDGSTDNSGVICDKFVKQDERIKVIHQQNKGLVSARKEGLKVAKGTYIGFVDGDDYIDSTFYEQLYSRITNTKADFVHAGYTLVQNGKEEKVCSFPQDIWDLNQCRHEVLAKYVLGLGEGSNIRISYSIWSKLFKRELIIKAYGNVPSSQQYGEDAINLCSCILESKKMATCDNYDYHYIERSGSMSHSYNITNIAQYMGLPNSLIQMFEKYKCNSCFASEMDSMKLYYIYLYMDEVRRNADLRERYHYQQIEELFNKKVVIYGAGNVGNDFYLQVSKYQDINIVLWVDQNFHQYKYDYAKITKVEDIKETEFDFLIIAVNNKEVANGIKNDLIHMGISESKIRWNKPVDLYFGS